MARWIGRLVAALLVLAIGAVAVFLIGIRRGSPRVVDGVRRFNRTVTNPRVLRSAGRPGASASVIRHVGRTSGRVYETPIGPFEIEDSFVIALPYGDRSDWLRNVLASGSATLVHDGREFDVDQPEVVSTESVIAGLPTGEQRTLSIFSVDRCLRLRRRPGLADADDSASSPAST